MKNIAKGHKMPDGSMIDINIIGEDWIKNEVTIEILEYKLMDGLAKKALDEFYNLEGEGEEPKLKGLLR